MFVVRTRIAQVNSITGYFDDQVLAKRRILPIIDESGTLPYCACGDYTWCCRKARRLIVNFLMS